MSERNRYGFPLSPGKADFGTAQQIAEEMGVICDNLRKIGAHPGDIALGMATAICVLARVVGVKQERLKILLHETVDTIYELDDEAQLQSRKATKERG